MKSIKRFGCMFLAVWMLCGILATAGYAAEIPDQQVQGLVVGQITVADYRAWLAGPQWRVYGQDGDRQQNILLAFDALATNKQEQFVAYLNDKQLMEEVALAFMSGEEKTVFADGDIVVQAVDSTPEANARAVTYTTKATHTRTISFLGIDIVEVENYVTYNHTSSTVTGVVRGGMVTGKNYMPFFGISYSNDALYYTSSRAYHVSDLTCSFLYEGSGITYGSAEFGVYGTPSGGVGYWVSPY